VSLGSVRRRGEYDADQARTAPTPKLSHPPAGVMTPLRFAAIGLDHSHIWGQAELLRRAGAELVAFYAAEHALAQQSSSTAQFLSEVRCSAGST
jgi:hypothetical protein